MPAASNTYDYVQLSDAKRDSTPLAEEVALAIVYNGLNQAVMLVSPTDLEDFAVGFSVGSGIVEGTAKSMTSSSRAAARRCMPTWKFPAGPSGT
jgi:FdhD protein